MDEWFHHAKVVATLIVIVDPVGAAPLFAALTAGQDEASRRRNARWAGITVASVLVGAALAGERLLALFSVSMGSFTVAGGLLMLLTAVDMVRARPSPLKRTAEEAAEAERRATVGIVPVGIPMLAGPGSISTAVILAEQAHDWAERGFVLVVCVALGVASAAVLRTAGWIERALGRTGINVATRLMGILLAALAVEFVARGLADLGLARP